MSLTHLFNNTAHKKSTRGGRGISAGKGKTVGRGTKGQKARTGAGSKLNAWFEGGQTPVFRKAAKKRGFQSIRVKPITITTDIINRFYQDNEVVSLETLIAKKILRPSQLKSSVKVVKRNPLKVKVEFSGVKTSSSLAQTK